MSSSAGTALVFVDPLKAQGDGGAELGLAHAEEKTALPQTHANMHIHGVYCHGSSFSSADGSKRFAARRERCSRGDVPQAGHPQRKVVRGVLS
jgi:hypothetical protein